MESDPICARVAVSQRDRYRLYSEAGELDAEPSGALWYRATSAADMPVTGDWVSARIVGPGQAIVEAVLPRRTLFSRRAAGRRNEEQPIAANIDIVFVVTGLDGDFNLRRLERYLALAAESGAGPVVVLNKADLCDDLTARTAETATVAGDAPIVACSARSGEGVDALNRFLAAGSTAALLGSSGAGKSTLVNRLLGEERFRTKEVRESDSRGRHTTTRRELVPLPGGAFLIDTPGMRELQLWAGEESVGAAFGDISELGAGCRFRDCRHQGEPGCAVAGAVTEERLGSYHKLLRDARRHEKEKQGKVMQRALRKMYRQQRDVNERA